MRTVLALVAAAFVTAPALAELPPLIPRDVLFGNPEKAAPQLAPDGKHLAYLAPDKKNVLQVWVRTAGKADDRAVTQDEKRGIRQYFWAFDNKHLLYMQDVDGNEDFHLFAVDVEANKTRELTPFKGPCRAYLDETSRTSGRHQQAGQSTDMHRIDRDRRREAGLKPGNILGWTDEDHVRGGPTVNPDGSYDLLLRDAPDKPWRKLITVPSDDQGSITFFGSDPNDVYVSSSHGANTVRLLKMDGKTAKEAVVAEDKQYDVSGLFAQRKTNKPLAVAFTKARREWKILDDSIKADFEALAKVQRGDFSVASRTLDPAAPTAATMARWRTTSTTAMPRSRSVLQSAS